MNKSTLVAIKADLEERREKIVKELEKFTEGNGGKADSMFPQFGDKEDENAAEVATYSDNLSLEESLESTLHDIEKALQKITDGSYGICNYCKKPIDEKRLLARPASSACVACKNRLTKTS